MQQRVRDGGPNLSGPGYRPGKWLVNGLYWDEQARAIRPKAPHAVRFIDSTMAEGDDCVGRQMDFNTRLEHMRRLDAIGIGEITLPNQHVPFTELVDLVRAYRRLGLKTALNVKGAKTTFPLEPGWKDRFRRLVENLGPVTVSPPMIYPDEDLLIDFTGDLTKQQVADEIRECVSFVKGLGTRMVPWFGDMRFPPATIGLFALAAVEAGADGVYMVDSRGNCVPSSSRLFIEAIRECIGSDVDLYVQHHNSLGMATANAFSSVEGGANWVDVTVMGIAERGGCVALEEAAVAFEVYGYPTGIKLEGLYELGLFAQQAYGVALPPWKPILGDSWAMEEGWGHVTGPGAQTPGVEQEVQEFLVNGVAASLVGRRYQSVIGNKVLFGTEPGEVPPFVSQLVRSLGFEANDQQLQDVLQRCRAALSTSYSRHYLTYDEVESICRGTLNIP